MPVNDADIDIALRLADVAGAAIRPWFRRLETVETKDDRSPVTVADRAAEAAMRRLIEAERVQTFKAVPAMATMLVNHPDRARFDLSSLQEVFMSSLSSR